MIEKERKFIVIAPKIVEYLIRNGEENVIDITQTYLINLEGDEERIRKIYNRSNKETSYFHTIKRDTNIIGEREEIETKICKKTYDEIYKYRIMEIEKIRCILNGWEIDIYSSIHLIVAEYEFKNGETEMNRFPFDGCDLLEVTGNKNFKNSYLAERFGS